MGGHISSLSIQNNRIKYYFLNESKNKAINKKSPPNIFTFILQCKLHWLCHQEAEGPNTHRAYSIICLRNQPGQQEEIIQIGIHKHLGHKDYSCYNFLQLNRNFWKSWGILLALRKRTANGSVTENTILLWSLFHPIFINGLELTWPFAAIFSC